jgi:hypothetical protein
MLRRVIRYLTAIMLLLYGFAKINGSQFTILDSELDKPMGLVSGFWLTWYYFGYSPFFGNFLGVVEIAGALLLTFRRTTLLGACILAGVLGNVVLIDICYGVDSSGTIPAVLLLAGVLYLIAPHRKELVGLFLPATPDTTRSPGREISKWGVRFAMVALACGFTYWVANFSNRAPTPIDGAWDLVSVEPADLTAQLPVTLFFEYNRAYWAVFKTAAGDYQQHHFEVDRVKHRLGMWETWLTKGAQIFDGTYALAGNELTLNGAWQGSGNVVLQLRARRVR